MIKSYLAWLAGVCLLLAGAGCAGRAGGTVAMLTDYGTRDHYVGVLAGNVLRANPQARIVTVTHEIEPFNIAEGAFVLAEAAPEFPVSTVIVGVVDPGVGTARESIVVVTNAGRRLVGPDNGLFDLLIRRDGGVRAIYRISNPDLTRAGAESSTFHGRDRFAPVAGHLSRGVDPAAVGPELADYVRLDLPEPKQSGDWLRGAVVHVDHYGNIHTNLPTSWFEQGGTRGRIEVIAHDSCATGTLGHTYADVAEGEFVVLLNASGRVEVACNLGNAAARLGVSAGEAIELRLISPAAP